MSIRKLYNRICEIHRPVPADGGWGSRSRTDVEATVPCRIQVAGGTERWDGKVRGEATHRVFMPPFDLRSSDHLVIDGVRYDIVPPVNDAGGGMGHHLEVDVREYGA